MPFHITTSVLRRLLSRHGWKRAVLVTQWEVARKRACVGAATQLTAQWWPRFAFRLVQRIRAAAFVPTPSVDGRMLVIDRRNTPLVPGSVRDYQDWVRRNFTSRGHRILQTLTRSGGIPPATASQWYQDHQIPSAAI